MKFKQTGFTLIEMSVVLVVIGIIIGGVSIGKDLQRNAVYQKINATFVQGWASNYQSFFSRQGVVVGDTPAAPTLKVNGNTAERCSTNLHADMDKAGIAMPSGRGEGNEHAFVYLDSNGNPQQVEVCFQNVTWSIPGATSGYVTRPKNVMVLKGLTPDLATLLDSTIDGVTDARFGYFRESTQANSTATASVVWSVDNRMAHGSTQATNRDENQVTVVTGYYLMAQ